MAGQAGKWRYGLLPLAALWLGVNLLEAPRIEADLKDRAQRALDALGAAGVHPRVEGRDVTLRGEIADPAARAAALAGVVAAGARATVDALTVAPAKPENPDPAKTKPAAAAAAESPPVAKPGFPTRAEKAASGDLKDATANPVAAPYLFHVEKIGGKVALSGFYPDADAHSKIVAAAAGAFSRRELLDHLKPAGGAPHEFLDAALAGLGQLARLRSGALTLHDRAVRLSGEAGSADVADDIRARLAGALPGDFSLNAQITGPARDSEPVRAAPRVEPQAAPRIEPQAAPRVEPQAAPRVEPQAAPQVEPQAAPRVEPQAAPRVEPQAAPRVEPQAAPRVEPQAAPRVEPQAAPRVEPQAAPRVEPQAAPRIESKAAPAVSPARRAAVKPAPLDARACQARMAALVDDDPIVFTLGSARIEPGSAQTLDALASEAKRCPDVDFEIAGHTDDIGIVSENLELSRRRAESVLVYLVAVGVAPQRLTAVGYGETRPLVANVNDGNRARNRRIEFNLK